jgi:uncharacterized damage-inducible protein DinB
MTQQTMTEKDMFLNAFEREYETTLKVLRAYPPDKMSLKASDRSGTAGEIAWTIVLEQMLVDPIMKGEVMPQGLPPAPSTWKGLLDSFEAAHREAVQKLQKMTETEMNGPVRMPVGPKQIGEMRRGDALWMFHCDSIHHRGQISVYLRIAGAKVPSIYGPSGDEPWYE